MREAEGKTNKRPGEEGDFPTASFANGAGGPGGQIGPYKLLSVLGEGGFAVVYLAEQKGPVKRRVALKVIKPGMDTKQVSPLRGRASGPGPAGAPQYRSSLRCRND